MMQSRTSWTREEVIIAYALYCITPLSQINPSNKVIQQIASRIPHSVGSLVLRMKNFRFLDPGAPAGLCHVAKMDIEIFEEFKNDWGALSLSAENSTGLALFDSNAIHGAKSLSSLTDRSRTNRERAFFRKSVIAAYDNRCYISGCELPKMLVASHIKPFAACRNTSDRVNPQNGVCLNTFYDKAFDAGLLTILPTRQVLIAPSIKTSAHDEFTKRWLLDLDGQVLPQVKRFAPLKEFLEYHNDLIFQHSGGAIC